MSAFKDKLRQLRETAGLTQERLASEAGVPLSTLRGYEQGQRLPGFPAIVKLARAVGHSCEIFAECSDIAGADAEAKPAPKKGKRKGT